MGRKYIKQTLDISSTTCLGVCECGARIMEDSRDEVTIKLIKHLREVHPFAESFATRDFYRRKKVSA